MKKTLFFFVLGLFSISVYSQSIVGGLRQGSMSQYMFSGPYSNPSLAGIKEYGTSITAQVNRGESWEEQNGKVDIWSQRYGLDQSLFQGRGGFQFQWSKTELSSVAHTTEASWAYSHGFELKEDLILRAGLGGRLRTNVLSNYIHYPTVDPKLYNGSEKQLIFDAGISLHAKNMYWAIGMHKFFQQEIGHQFTFEILNEPVLSAEYGARLPFNKTKKGLWSWSAQPYVKAYFRNYDWAETVVGSFLNYGPVQIGGSRTWTGNTYVSTGFHSRLARISYTYRISSGSFWNENYPKHEVSLRFILPSGVCRRVGRPNFMGEVYRGF